MKKTILVVLLVMITTPCLAQEIEPDGIFSIGGTTWRCIGLAFLNTAPFIMPINDTTSFTSNKYNKDFLLFSLAPGSIKLSPPFDESLAWMIVQPTIGVGVFWAFIFQPYENNLPNNPWPRFVGVGFGYMFKIDDDNWTPPEEE